VVVAGGMARPAEHRRAARRCHRRGRRRDKLLPRCNRLETGVSPLPIAHAVGGAPLPVGDRATRLFTTSAPKPKTAAKPARRSSFSNCSPGTGLERQHGDYERDSELNHLQLRALPHERHQDEESRLEPGRNTTAD